MADTTAKIKQIPWTPDIDDRVRIAAKRPESLQLIKNQVKNGIAQLWHCKSDRHECWVVTRIDPPDELCIVLGQGSGMMQFAPAFIAGAHKKGLTVRTHITRPGLIRMWRRLGLSLSEYVLRG